MKELLTIILICLCNFQIVNACSCRSAPDFCSTIANREGDLAHKVSVVRVVVEQSNQNVLITRMTDFLGGDLPKNNILTINGGNGSNCLMSVSSFRVGEEVIFAAKYNEEYDAYSLTACGIPFLMVNDEMVTGRISGKIRRVPYHKLGEIISCQVINPTKLNQIVGIFPTLTRDMISIIFNSLHSNSITAAWDLISMDGRLIQSTTFIEYNVRENIPVDLSYLPKGMYLLRIRNEGEDFVTHKVIKGN